MKILNQLIKANIIPILEAGLIDCDYNLYGLVTPVKTDKEIKHAEYDDSSKICVGIHPDDKKDLWGVFILDSIDPVIISEIGTKKRYNAVASIDFIGYSKTFREAPDYVMSRFAKVKNLTFTRLDPDSYKALQRLSNSKYYNTQHDLFTVSFKYNYVTDFCSVETLTGVEACT